MYLSGNVTSEQMQETNSNDNRVNESFQDAC